MDVFGDVVTYRPATGAAYDIADAVFDEAYQVVLEGEDGAPPVSTTMPVLGMRRALMQAEPRQSDQVDVPGWGRYRVRDLRPDGHGHVLLLLSFAGAIS
jgi:hypothetical protein